MEKNNKKLLTLHIQKSTEVEDEDLNLMKFFELLYKVDRRNEQKRNIDIDNKSQSKHNFLK